MTTPINFGQASSSGGAYGTHNSGNKTTRQRRNPSDYGPFSSPHASFDDPVPFPPYAELPFTSLKRRRQFQDQQSLGKLVMKAVLLSPVVVLVLWSVAAAMFASNHRSININSRNMKNSRQLPMKSKQIPRNHFGNGHNNVMNQNPEMYQAQQQPLQDTTANIVYVNGVPMLMTPLKTSSEGMMKTENSQTVMANSIQQSGLRSIPDSQAAVPLRLTNNGKAEVPVINAIQLSVPQDQPGLSMVGAALPQEHPVLSVTNSNQQTPLKTTSLGVSAPAAMQSPNTMQLSDTSTGAQNQVQAAPTKQAVYYYDPNDTTISQNGDIISMPALVYDQNRKAIPLAELQHKAPTYVQPPVLGSSSTDSNNDVKIADAVGAASELVAPSARGSTLVNPTTKEASISMPQAWGTSQSQDQTIIVATVAVMALLVGALSARRLRSKSFLASCIENESLEDDVAYDDAYTTTAAASGAVGVDSSYNTFGGWKGDLEKFDV